MPSRRREFLAGAVAGGAATLIAPGGVAAGAATPVGGPSAHDDLILRRGRDIAASADGRYLVIAHDRRQSIAIVDRHKRASKLIELDSQPLSVAVSPDGSLAAVTTAYWTKPGVILIDLRRGRIAGHVEAGKAPSDVAFVANKRLVVVGGEQEGTAYLVDLKGPRKIKQTPLGRVPRSVAVAAGAIWVTLNGEAAVVRLDPESAKVTKRIATPELPDALAASPDGRRLLVGHRGGVSELTTAGPRGRARRLFNGREPSAVAYGAAGRRLVALGSEASVLVIDTSGRKRRRAVAPGPRGLALARRRAFTVSVLTGAVSEVRL
jgi:DNA-binding beta-propeller fold protein YncE